MDSALKSALTCHSLQSMIWPSSSQTASASKLATCEIEDDIVLITRHDPVEELRQLHLSVDELILVRN